MSDCARSETESVSFWVIAALGVQVLMASMSLAASTCGETLERTRVTRISGPMVQAIRDLVEHHDSADRARVIEHDSIEVPVALSTTAPVLRVIESRVSVLWTALPPPSVR